MNIRFSALFLILIVFNSVCFADSNCNKTVKTILDKLQVHHEKDLPQTDNESKTSAYKIRERAIGLLASTSDRPIYDRKSTFKAMGPSFVEVRSYYKNNRPLGLILVTPTNHDLSITLDNNCEPNFFVITGPLWSAGLSKGACASKYIQNPNLLPKKSDITWKGVCERGGGHILNNSNQCSCVRSGAPNDPSVCPQKLIEDIAEAEIARLGTPPPNIRQQFLTPNQEEATKVKEICMSVYGPIVISANSSSAASPTAAP